MYRTNIIAIKFVIFLKKTMEDKKLLEDTANITGQAKVAQASSFVDFVLK